MKAASLFWIARHPLVAMQEIPAAIRQVPDYLRGKRIKSTNSDTATTTFAHSILTHARERGDIPPNWDVQTAFSTRSGEAVLRIGRSGGATEAILKIASSSASNRYLDLHRSVVQALLADKRLDGWHDLLPKLLASGEVEGRRYAFEQWIRGVELIDAFDKAASMNAIAAIDAVHDATGDLQTVTPDMVAAWFDPALQSLADVRHVSVNDDPALRMLRNRLAGALVGKSVWIGRVHGDYHPGNILVDPDTQAVTAILDWDRSQPDRPAFFDIAYQALTAHVQETGARFGTAVYEIADAVAPLGPLARTMVDSDLAAFRGDAIDDATLVLSAWLQHVGANLDNSERYHSHPLWVHRVVDVVLNRLAVE